MTEKKLFDKVNLGRLNLKNRLIRSATAQGHMEPLKYSNEKLYQIYGELATGGIGAIITSFPLVDSDYFRESAELTGEQIYEKITALCHAQDCPAIAQLVLVDYLRAENKRKVDIDNMTGDDIEAVVDMFATAAERAEKAGYKGVQIHAAHGLFLSRFISPAYNHRTDIYGGSIDNRSKIILDIMQEIRNRSPHLHISMKINCSDFVDGGLTPEDSLMVCKLCASARIDSIEVSGNGSSAPGIRAGVNESYYKDFALRLSEEVNIPVILVGGNRSIDSMESILNKGNIECFSLSRPLIREPNLPLRWANGDTAPAKCVSCNMCYQTPWQDCIFHIRDYE
ncbi:MAG: NADH:flavin oxidoreductase [Fibrobacter sp.]|nr:NADH:flavin oxidoreductase [Fibrobacter sp.]